ncbi:MAG TPA: hypothetical protein VKH35_01425 [Thermoanaerobaculia bacterium]|nr:hypothetical protein [Thermoanaerobaculia bacterium]
MPRVPLVALALFLCGTSAFACRVDDPGFSAGYRGDSILAVNLDLNDYGRIEADADDPHCVEAALAALRTKLANSLDASPNAFRRWLDSYNVALVMATANRLGNQGWATAGACSGSVTPAPPLDCLLTLVAQRFEAGVTLPEPIPCGLEVDPPNTCMDDRSGDASAYAWIAAYRAGRGEDVDSLQEKAIDAIHGGFAAICIHDPVKFAASDRTVLCNGTVAELAGGSAFTLTLNHGYELVHYGFGQLTSIASAVVGLRASGYDGHYGPTLSVDDEIVARGLFAEVQRAALDDADFRGPDAGGHGGCITPIRSGGRWTLLDNAWCGGDPSREPVYHPDMYHLNDSDFTARTFFPDIVDAPPGIPGTTYRSNAPINEQRFADPNGYFSIGRFEVYEKHGFEWIARSEGRDAQSWFMPPNRHPPIGYFEGVSRDGVARGWACDSDFPWSEPSEVRGAVSVDVVDGAENVVASARADLASESAVNAQCGGGTAHRFAIQLPFAVRGTELRVVAHDYTWIGTSMLRCLAPEGCSWPALRRRPSS